MEKEHVKNRQATEQLLLEAVNRLETYSLRWYAVKWLWNRMDSKG